MRIRTLLLTPYLALHFALLSALLMPSMGFAQKTRAIPPALAPWVPWVLDGREHMACPFMLGEPFDNGVAHPCAWPGQLSLDVIKDSARFSMTWTVLAEDSVRLPGDLRLRPQNVTVDGRSAVVLMNGSSPTLRLQPGVYRVEGQLSWTDRPTQLPVPDAIALVKLRLDGAEIAVPERDGDQLWLGRITTEVGADTLDVRVYRRLEDGMPVRLTTRLNLEISGRAREVTLSAALPSGFAPIAVQSSLPAALLADGGLRVQLRPGTWPITIEARALDVIDSAGPPAADSPWPEQEIWSWRSAPELRVVEVEGGTPVDPAQVDAPWGEQLPTSVLDRTQSMTIAERSRGKDADQAHRLSLQRELWLAFDGDGVVARDQLTGKLATIGRLNVSAPWTLERASETGGDLLVTTDAAGNVGVELRNPQLSLLSTGRIAGRGSMPASGWDVDFESMSAVLNLPPGWRLFAAGGVDQAPQTWVGQWTLLDLFLLAVAALLAFRLHGVGFAALILAYVTLGYHEENSPLWSLLAVIALSLILGFLSTGRLAKALHVLRAVALGAAFVLALPFVAQQLKLALHPQLERGAVESSSGYGGGYLSRQSASYDTQAAEGEQYKEDMDRPEVTRSRIAQETGAPPPMVLDDPTPMSIAAPPPAPPAPPPPAGALSSKRVNVQNINAYPEDAVLQAGPGTPDWRWQRIDLGWSGPVLADQSMNLWLSPPWLTRLLRVAAVTLLVLVLLRLASSLGQLPGWRTRAKVTPALLLFALCMALPSAPARAADYPPQALLDELQLRLLQAPACAPQCASLEATEIEMIGDELRVAMVLDAEANVAVPLPDPGKSASAQRAELAGSEVPVLQQSGQRWVTLAGGVQRLQLSWKVAAVDQLDLRFPMSPAAVRVRASGWETGSLDGTRLLGDTLQLLRLRVADASSTELDTAAAAQEFPPFVRVTRQLMLDLDWTVQTTVERVAPAQSGFTLILPLIDGERVLDDGLEVSDNSVKLSFAAGEQSKHWRSRLPISEVVELSMGPLRQASEHWQVQVGAYWHAEMSGLPESNIDAADGIRRFDPRPDEQLKIDITRPAAVAGSSLAFDQVTLAMRQGSRARDSQLTAQLRSTRGGQHVVRIPADAELISVTIDGQPHALRVTDGQLRLPVLPGTHGLDLQWRRALDVSMRQRGDVVDLGAPAANLRTQLVVDSERWLLAAGGAGVGPAVLYWGQLLVMILVAAGLARLSTFTPLKFHHWLLLGLGFSTVSWLAGGVVVAWLLLLGWRQRKAAWIISHSVFPLIQLLLVLVSITALVVLVSAVPYGLLGSPDMQVVGNGSSAGRLLWFSDESAGALPSIWAISLPLWTYKLAILLWALWLANALISWLRWGWQSLSAGGYWPARKPKKLEASDAAVGNTHDPIGTEPPPIP